MKVLITTIILALWLQSLPGSDNPNTMKKQILLGDEKELEVTISFGAGKLCIRPAEKGTLFKGKFEFKRWEPSVKYSVINDIGRLQIYMPDIKKDKDEKGSHIDISNLNDLKQNTWELQFSPDIPIRFKIEMGASENNFDFASMKIQELKIQTGASDMEIDFSKPNPIRMDKFIIEAGVSRILGKNLLNANFKKFSFNGGVGDYEFYLTGELKYNARVDIESGVSSTILYIDPKLAFRADVDKSFLSSVRVEGAEKEDNTYFSDNYERGKKRLDIFAEIGIGSFKILLGD